MNRKYRVSELCDLFEGTPKYVMNDRLFQSFSIDSRTVQAGDLFFCIRGENTDGHHYIEQALIKGAGCIIANQERIPKSLQRKKFNLIFVKDPNQALLQLAQSYRRFYQKGTVFGITGSNGKTSTKEIAHTLCQHISQDVHATQGNLNNLIGVPLTLLSANLEEDWWVIEMGTNQFGEIPTLSTTVQPDIAMITSIGESHLEFLQSTAGVAREKAEIVLGMSSDSPLLIPQHLKHQEIVEELATSQAVCLNTFGFDHLSVSPLRKAKQWRATLKKRTLAETTFSFLGEQFSTSISNPLLIENLLGVLLMFHLSGIATTELVKAVQLMQIDIPGRMQILQKSPYFIVHDAYNANPSSFEATMKSLREMYPQKRILMVAGYMAELGKQSAELHYNVGTMAQKYHINYLLAYGQDDVIPSYIEGWLAADGKKEHALHCREEQEFLSRFTEWCQPNDIILFKASRKAKLELLIAQIQNMDLLS